jgi:hypothetical protein
MARKLSAKMKEDLADARVLLETAAHNIQVALRAEQGDEGIGAALTMADQAVSALRRVQEKLAAG